MILLFGEFVKDYLKKVTRIQDFVFLVSTKLAPDVMVA